MKKVEDFILPAAIIVNRYAEDFAENYHIAAEVLDVAEALQKNYAKRAGLQPFRRQHIELIQEGKYVAKICEKTAQIRILDILEQETGYPIEAITGRPFADGYVEKNTFHFSNEGKCLEYPEIPLMVKNAAYEDE